MPKSSASETISRQWEILQLLPSAGSGVSTSELVKKLNNLGYEVDIRTVQRDLNHLLEAFPAIECLDKSIPYGWRWAKSASMSVPGVTTAEAVSLKIIENILKPILPKAIYQSIEPRLNQAKEKSKIRSKHQKIRPWDKKVAYIDSNQPLLPPSIDDDVLDIVQNALMHEVQLEVMYQGIEEEEPKEMVLHPLALIQRGIGTYLITTAFKYDDILQLPVQRIKSAIRLADRCKAPKGFDLDEFIKSDAPHFGDAKPIKLKAKISSDLAKILEETPLSSDQIIKSSDQQILVQATVSHTWQLTRWVLSQADAITVISPKSFQKEIKNSLLNAVKQYAGG